MALPPLATVNLHRISLAYRAIGSGPTVMLLHGFGASSATWEPQFDTLGSTYNLIAWDMPGFGGSDEFRSDDPSVDDYADALRGMVDALELPRVTLIGHSLGAVVAAAFAARHRDITSFMVLEASAKGDGGLEEDERKARLDTRLDDLENFGAKGIADRMTPKLLGADAPEEARELVHRLLSRIRPRGYGQAARMMYQADIFDYTDAVDTPVLVMRGSDDAIVPEETSREIAAAIDRAQFAQIEGVGHTPHLENAAEFDEFVSAFLLGKDVST